MKEYKDQNYRTFKILRGIGVPIFNLIYHPKINNKDLIPENEPTIFFGNHRHVFDQFPVICATSKYTRWFAKKEYFDSKIGPLYKATGCIEVDRDGDTSSAMDEALYCLENGGSVGIFPEGTRNIYYLAIIAKEQALFEFKNMIDKYGIENEKTKKSFINYKKACESITKAKEILEKRGFDVIEDEELLPFKKGAAILANKTGASLIPFAVTGDYKFLNNNLIVSFGEKIEPGNKTVEDLNKEMYASVKKLVLKQELKSN